MDKAHFQKGTLTTCLLVSAPGLKELQENKPLSGQSGKNLQKALPLLQERYPEYFPSVELEDYRITNSIDTVLSKRTTIKTEATKNEILTETNIERLRDELKGMDTVIAFGSKAALAIESCGFKGHILMAEHPSFQNINFRYQSNLPTVEERSLDRLKQWVDSIK